MQWLICLKTVALLSYVARLDNVQKSGKNSEINLRDVRISIKIHLVYKYAHIF